MKHFINEHESTGCKFDSIQDFPDAISDLAATCDM